MKEMQVWAARRTERTNLPALRKSLSTPAQPRFSRGGRMRRIVAVLFLFALPVIAQDNPRETIKTLDDYCIAISKKVDAMDGIDTNRDSILSGLPSAEGAKVVEYLNSLRALRLAIRHDACDA